MFSSFEAYPLDQPTLAKRAHPTHQVQRRVRPDLRVRFTEACGPPQRGQFPNLGRLGVRQ